MIDTSGRVTVVVRAHPLRDCFIDAVHQRAVTALCQRGDAIVELDLYADGHRTGEPLLPDHCDALARASSIVLVYPTWWSAHPAVLLDWILALRSQNLVAVNELMCVTTHGGGHLANVVIGRAGRLTVSNMLRRRCAPGASFSFVACYGLDRAGADHRDRFLDTVDRKLSRPAHVSRVRRTRIGA